MKNVVFLLMVMGILSGAGACSTRRTVDLVLYNAIVYTIDADFSLCEAFAVQDGRFIETGTAEYILGKYKGRREVDAKGLPVYPAFNDAHSHFLQVAEGLRYVDLRGAASVHEVTDRLKDHYNKYKPAFIVGDGWDQTLWADPSLPLNDALNEAFPDIPVYLRRVDFHAIWVNDRAIRLAGLTENDPDIPRGEALYRPGSGKFTGVFLENTYERINANIPPMDRETQIECIKEAQELCFSWGLGSVTDAGLPLCSIELFDSLAKSSTLKLRLDIWMNPSEENFTHFPRPYRSDRLSVSAVKIYIDGALGSAGALLFEPYSDNPASFGIQVTPDGTFLAICKKASDAGFQVATHAIGDKGVSKVLDLYTPFLAPDNDLRWRIEHSQVVAPKDFVRFSELNVVPSIQPTHATSDMGWAATRLGPVRVKGAYACKRLIETIGWAPFGTDAPVESINPLYTFFSAVTRMNADMQPEGGWQSEDAVSRENALRGMTIWAAKGNFEETKKGSIEKNKAADFIIWSGDLMTLPAAEILSTHCMATYINGELLFSVGQISGITQTGNNI